MKTAGAPSLTLSRLPLLTLVVAVVVGGGLGLTGVLRTVADLYPGPLPPEPFFVPERALLLYGAMPLALLAMIGMLLVPGFLLVLATGGAARTGVLAATSFGGALLLRTLAHTALKLTGMPLGATTFILTEVVLDTVLLGLVAVRLRSGRPVMMPEGPEDRRRLSWMIAIVVLAAILLLPTFFWHDITEDGVEALEIGRSLTVHVVPRFPVSASGVMGLGVGLVAMAYPNSWFVSMIGPVEAAARLPMILYLPLLFAVVTDLMEFGAARRLGRIGEAAIVVALATYTAAMVFSASYTPYSADASSPAAFETLTVLCIAATILFLWRGRMGWMLSFALLAYFARPTGLLVLGLLAIGTMALAPTERRRQLTHLLLAIGLCIAAGTFYERAMVPRLADGLPVGYASSSLLERLRYLTFTDVQRLLFLVVPSGLLPAIALFAWRHQDALARQLTLFCGLYFLFFYPQAFVALHHFVPVMILPVVVYWRIALAGQSRWPAGAAVIAAGIGLVLSLPRSTGLDRSTRALGRASDFQVGNLNGSWPAHRDALYSRRGLGVIFRPEWQVTDAAQERVGDLLSVLYYSSQAPTSPDSVNYVIQVEGAVPPPGFTLVETERGISTLVRDTARWRRDQATPPRTDFRAAVYDVPRSTLHRFLGIRAHAYQVDLARLPVLWRFF